VGKPEEKSLLGRSRHRWENNVKMELQEVRSEIMDLTDLNRYRDM
jgi:hypothetical protein